MPKQCPVKGMKEYYQFSIHIYWTFRLSPWLTVPSILEVPTAISTL